MVRISFIGNLAADAQIRDANGKQYLTFRVADTRRWSDQAGNQHEETQWFSCIMELRSSNLPQYLKKGVKVFCEGNPTIEIYSSPKLKRMTARYNVNVQHVELCGGSSDEVPRRLVDENGVIVDIFKAYYIPKDVSEPYRKKQLYGERGGVYQVDNIGYVVPVVEQATESTAQDNAADGAQDTANQPPF